MKVLWKNAKEVFQEYTIWTHEKEMVWFQQVWELFEQKGLTSWNSAVEKMAVYNRIYGIVWIFRNFCEAGFGEDAYFDFYWEDAFRDVLQKMEEMFPEDDDCTEDIHTQVESILNNLICGRAVIYTIFDVLKEHLGREQLFASLWASCCPDEIEYDDSFDDDFYDEDSFEEDFSSIMNENLEDEKLAAYEWLSSYLE